MQVETVIKTRPSIPVMPEDNLQSSSDTTVNQDSLSPGLTTLPAASAETPSNDAGASAQLTESTTAVAKETAVSSSEGLTEDTGESKENNSSQAEVSVQQLSVQDSSQKEDAPADLSATNSDESNGTEAPVPASDNNV